MNPSLLSYNKDYNPNTAIRVFTNNGNLYNKQSDTIDLLPLKVFYNPYSVYIILELGDITNQFIGTMDNNNEPVMFVHTVPDSVLKFYQWCK